VKAVDSREALRIPLLGAVDGLLLREAIRQNFLRRRQYYLPGLVKED
jgi:hypothetical protein